MATTNGIFVDYISNGAASGNYTSHTSLSASVCGGMMAAPVNFPGTVGVYGDVPAADQPWPSNVSNPDTSQWGKPSPNGHSYDWGSVSGVYTAAVNAGQIPIVSAYRGTNYMCGEPDLGGTVSPANWVIPVTWSEAQYDTMLASEMEYICQTYLKNYGACIVGNEFKGLYGSKPNDYQIGRYINSYNAIWTRLNNNPNTNKILMGGPYLYSANSGVSGATLAPSGSWSGYPWPVEFSFGGYDLRPSDSNAIDTFIQQANGIDIFATECTVGDWGVTGFQAFWEWALSRFQTFKKPLPAAIMVTEFYAGTGTAANLGSYQNALCAAAAQYGIVAMFNLWDDMTVSNPGHTISSGGSLTDCGAAIQTYYSQGNKQAAFPKRVSSSSSSGGGTTNTPPPTPTTNYPLLVLHDSPQGYWRLNETTGTTAFDYSSNNNPGTYTGTVTLDQPGPLVRDNTTAAMASPKTGYVVVPNITQLDLTGSAVSVECWVKSAGSQNPFGGLVWKDNGTTTLMGYGINMDATFHPYMNVTTTTGNLTSGLPTFNTWDTNWHHLVGTYDGTHITLYLDGTQIAQASGSGTIVDSSSSPLWLGGLSNGSSTNYLWNGSIAECAVYNYALTAAQAVSHYQTGIGTAGASTSAVVATTSGTVGIPELLYNIAGSCTTVTSDASSHVLGGAVLGTTGTVTVVTTDAGAPSGQYYTTGTSVTTTTDSGALGATSNGTGSCVTVTVDQATVKTILNPRWGVVQI